jgi:DNA-binding MarR family transcriptional regulator
MIKKKNKHCSSSFLLKRGNVGLARLLLAVYDAGPDGISTRKLLQQLGSTHHAQAFIKRAEKMGYIRREERDPESGTGFRPVYNILTEKGRKLLAGSQL